MKHEFHVKTLKIFLQKQREQKVPFGWGKNKVNWSVVPAAQPSVASRLVSVYGLNA